MYAVLRHWRDWLPGLGLGIEDLDLVSDSAEDLTTILAGGRYKTNAYTVAIAYKSSACIESQRIGYKQSYTICGLTEDKFNNAMVQLTDGTETWIYSFPLLMIFHITYNITYPFISILSERSCTMVETQNKKTRTQINKCYL